MTDELTHAGMLGVEQSVGQLAGLALDAQDHETWHPRRFPVFRRALRYRRTQIGLGLTVVVILISLVGPLVAPHGLSDFVGSPYTGPSSAAPLGTDYVGHDVLTEVLNGGVSLLWMAFAATSLGVLFGVALGLFAGYSRNLADDAIMRLLDIQLAFPPIVFVLLFVAMLGHHAWLIVLLVAFGNVPGVARVTRGVTLDLTSREFVEAAEVIGTPRRRILVKEILPNAAAPLLVEYSLRLTWAIVIIASLSFLGFGVQPPATDWGLMVNQNRNGLVLTPWATVAPIICVALFAIGTNLIGEGISRSVAGIDR